MELENILHDQKATFALCWFLSMFSFNLTFLIHLINAIELQTHKILNKIISQVVASCICRTVTKISISWKYKAKSTGYSSFMTGKWSSQQKIISPKIGHLKQELCYPRFMAKLPKILLGVIHR